VVPASTSVHPIKTALLESVSVRTVGPSAATFAVHLIKPAVVVSAQTSAVIVAIVECVAMSVHLVKPVVAVPSQI
jgi:hypothetical protein